MTPRPTAAKVPPVVFVIDDDASVRAALSSLVRSVGLRVEVFASASEFLATKRTDGPSCLILDVRLPGVSGLDFQTELAKADSVIPTIFITGHGDIPMSVKAMKAGAVEFLTKPFRDQDLLDAIKVALERARSRDESENAVSELRAKFENPFASREGGYGAGNWRSPQQANCCGTRSERSYRKGPSWQRNAENGG